MPPALPSRPLRALAAALLCAALALGPAAAAAAQDVGGGRETAHFVDIRGHWAEVFVLTLQYAGIITVPEDGRFRPAEDVTRLDFTVWLARALELSPVQPARPPFRDWDRIPADVRGLVAAAAAAGLVGGYTDGTFRPDRPITRAEMGVLFGRELTRLGVPVEERYLRLFADRDRFPAWAKPALAAVKAGIIRGRPQGPGKEPVFAPRASTSRAETAVMLVRFVEVREEITGLPRLEPPTARPRGPIFAAYYDNRDVAYASLTAFGHHVDWLIYVRHVIQPDGTISGYHSPRTLAWAAQSGRPVLVMFGNHDRQINHALLTNPEAQVRAAKAIRDMLVERGYAGINLDMEDIPWEDRPLLTAFVRRLAEALRPAGKLVTIAVPAKTSDNPRHAWSGAFDYAALGELVDYVVIMTYDEHWPSSPPGPIGSLPWMEAVVRYAASVIPPSKILLGIPGYAYDWPDGGRARGIFGKAAPDLAQRNGARPAYDAALGEATFTYRGEDGRRHTVWYTPPEGVAAKLRLVERYRLAGAAYWQMGYEGPEFWQAVREVLRRP